MITATLTGHAVAQLPPDNIRKITDDYHVFGKIRDSVVNTNTGQPAQFMLYPNIWIRFTREMQLWLFDVECLSCYGRVIPKSDTYRKEAEYNFTKLFDSGRCFNNGAGVDKFANYVTGERLDPVILPMWEPLVLTNNLVELIGERENIVTNYYDFPVASYGHYKIRSMDVNNLPSPSEFLQDKCVCHDCTTVRPDGTIGAFPWFNGRAVYPVWSRGVVYVWERLLNP